LPLFLVKVLLYVVSSSTLIIVVSDYGLDEWDSISGSGRNALPHHAPPPPSLITCGYWRLLLRR